LEFPPQDRSIYERMVGNPFDIIAHWRRPQDFLHVDFSQGLLEPNVFYETIEPNDVKPGILGDEWFLSAVALLAERPVLIERLFITKEMNSAGVYKLRLCKNGEWVTVTVDDFMPCYPEGETLFA
jgi:calpain-15